MRSASDRTTDGVAGRKCAPAAWPDSMYFNGSSLNPIALFDGVRFFGTTDDDDDDDKEEDAFGVASVVNFAVYICVGSWCAKLSTAGSYGTEVPINVASSSSSPSLALFAIVLVLLLAATVLVVLLLVVASGAPLAVADDDFFLLRLVR